METRQLPRATTTQVQEAVDLRHPHPNAATLNALGRDGTMLTLDGQPVSAEADIRLITNSEILNIIKDVWGPQT